MWIRAKSLCVLARKVFSRTFRKLRPHFRWLGRRLGLLLEFKYGKIWMCANHSSRLRSYKRGRIFPIPSITDSFLCLLQSISFFCGSKLWGFFRLYKSVFIQIFHRFPPKTNRHSHSSTLDGRNAGRKYFNQYRPNVTCAD